MYKMIILKSLADSKTENWAVEAPQPTQLILNRIRVFDSLQRIYLSLGDQNFRQVFLLSGSTWGEDICGHWRWAGVKRTLYCIRNATKSSWQKKEFRWNVISEAWNQETHLESPVLRRRRTQALASGPPASSTWHQAKPHKFNEVLPW